MAQTGHASRGSSHCVPLSTVTVPYNLPSPPTPPKFRGRSSKGQATLQQPLKWVMLSLSRVICYKPLLTKQVLLESNLAQAFAFSNHGRGRLLVIYWSPSLPHQTPVKCHHPVTLESLAVWHSWATFGHSRSQIYSQTSTIKTAQIWHKYSQSQVMEVSERMGNSDVLKTPAFCMGLQNPCLCMEIFRWTSSNDFNWPETSVSKFQIHLY